MFAWRILHCSQTDPNPAPIRSITLSSTIASDKLLILRQSLIWRNPFVFDVNAAGAIVQSCL